MYLYLNTASIIRILSDVRQNSFTPFVIYNVLVLFFSFQRPRREIQELYIRYIYYIYIIYIRSKCTLLLQHFKFYLFLLFSITPPPLSSFDLLLWLGGGAWMQKVREHASIARSEQKKILIPGGEYNRYL